MNAFVNQIHYYSEADLLNIPDTPLAFLRQLRGLCVFDIQGHHTSQTRVMTTLIHGNEPSGFIALHRWLKKRRKPEVNIRVIVCNTEAAQLLPEFSHRYLNEGQDLNRFFTSATDISNKSTPKALVKTVGENATTEIGFLENTDIIHRAEQIKHAVNAVAPEAVIDLHNTSGLSPAFGVAINDKPKTLDLISLFTNKVILTGLRFGAIMEQDFSAPIVTIECGGAEQIQSHQLAYAGLSKFVSQANIFDRRARQVDIHQHPCRVELLPHVSVAFGHNHLPTADVTLRADAEQLNNQLTPAGEFIGWYGGEGRLPLTAKNEQGQEQVANMLSLENGRIFTKQSLQIFMATTDQSIATNDCLFYATFETE
ncbi:hypothetical protein NBRC116592_02470 [Colwellia sp. KU-HH00111]|uniref:hypothetical protein n=1 Tax=Colwellia sp. KU-HH00111 TaxID=3127652 RepID=UPI0031033F32